MFNMLNRSWYDNPWRRMRQLQREMNRLLGDFGSPAAGGYPGINIHSTEDGAVVKAELPGINPEELDITASENTLTIRGERKRSEPEAQAAWHRRERRMGAFTRSIEMPFAIDGDRVEAQFKNGLLSVKLRRVESQQPRKIAVKEG